MSVDIIIRADSFDTLVQTLAAINYADVPSDVVIRAAVCKELQTVLDALLDEPETNASLTLIPEEAREIFEQFLDDITKYGFAISDIKIIDYSGSLLIKMENLDAKYSHR